MPRGRPWPKGVSGNPAGPPKGHKKRHRMREEIERALAATDASGQSQEAVIADALVKLAAKGDLKAVELLLKRTWPEKLELGVDEDTRSDLARDLLEARRRAREMRKK